MPSLKANILVVDDDPAIRELIGQRLIHVGHNVTFACDGQEALLLLQQHPIDLVLLDIMMPNLDGFAVLKSLRTKHAPTSLPIMMLTARDGGEDVIRAFQTGANDYITKPIDFNLFFTRLNTHLTIKAGLGQNIGEYRTEGKIGAGGMGTVLAAVHKSTGQKVALKILPRSLTFDPDYVERFLREGELASRVKHPNLVHILEVGHDGETHYIAMEMVPGLNLADLVAQAPLAIESAVSIGMQLTMALESLQQANIVHRDIKPENIIVSNDGKTKITDFGIARELSSPSRLTTTGVGLGSIIYASPEQMRGVGDFRSDIYSLGCTLFFMITGEDPFSPEHSLDELFADKTSRPPRLVPSANHLPKPLRLLILQMLDPKPAKRFSSYEVLRTSLQQAVQRENGKNSGRRWWPW